MLTDYKFWFIRRDDDGFITEAGVRFYEGDITTVVERKPGLTKTEDLNTLLPITKYRRVRRLQEKDLPHLGTKVFAKEVNGDAPIYTPNHFGSIKTDDELCTFLNKELGKDKGRTSIDEQKHK